MIPFHLSTLGRAAVLAAVCLLPSPAVATSAPTGDNYPWFIREGAAVGIAFRCLDYRHDGDVSACGQETTEEQPSDCFMQALDTAGAPLGPRRRADCGQLIDAGRSPIGSRIVDRHGDELRLTRDAAIEGAIWTLDHDPMQVRRFDLLGQSVVPLRSDGFQVIERGLAVSADTFAAMGRLCQGTFEWAGLAWQCKGSSNHWRGDFGVILLDRHAQRPPRVVYLDEPVFVSLADRTATPVVAADQVFVAWAKAVDEDSPLAVASIDLASGRRCERTWDAPGAQPPYPIEQARLDDRRVLIVFAREGRIRWLSIDTAAWVSSCGADGVDIHDMPPYAATAP